MTKENSILMDSKVEELLRKNNLSITESRKKILQLFFDETGALAHRNIEKGAGEKFDRVTIYRTLQTFVDKGIIHSIPSVDNAVRYALCKDECMEGLHRDRHIHFICNSCNNTFCLDDVVTPEIKLPKGYNAGHVEVVVEGICKNCK